MERWSVPKGTERRLFLLVWLSICLNFGVQQLQQVWHAAHDKPDLLASWLRLALHVVYTAHYAALVFILAFRPITYRRYKILLDESHLHHCQLVHLFDAYFPITGVPRRPVWPIAHGAILSVNPTFHNLPLESILRVVSTASLSHLAIKHASLRHHLPGLSWSGYLLQMGLQAVVPGAIALAVAMLMGRTDMPPQAHGAAGTARRAWTARDGLVACHRAQVFAQQHLRPLLIVVSGACVLYQMLRCFIEGSKDVDMKVHTNVMFEMVVMGSSFALGLHGIMAEVQPKLAGALRLLYDLVPQHIAEALMEQESDAGASSGVAPREGVRSGPPASGSASHDRQASSKPVTPEEEEQQDAAPPPSEGAPAAPGLARAADAPSPTGVGTPAGSGDLASTAGLLARTSSAQLSVAAIASQLQQAAAFLLSEQRQQGGAAAAGGGGSWTARRLVSNLLEGLRESVAEPSASSALSTAQSLQLHDAALVGGPHVTGQQVQVPEALTLDGKLSRTPQIASWHEHTSILFCDIQGFTDCCQAVPPSSVMSMLNELFFRIDGLCMGPESRVTKIETVGDCVMAATGLLHDDPDHAVTMLDFAVGLQREARQVLYPHNGQPLRMRVGVHSGRVMSGVVGRIRKRYCLFGDTVNTASRMESNGEPGRIHVSSATHDLVQASPWRHEWRFECRGEIPIKGKGMMTTFFVERAGPATP